MKSVVKSVGYTMLLMLAQVLFMIMLEPFNELYGVMLAALLGTISIGCLVSLGSLQKLWEEFKAEIMYRDTLTGGLLMGVMLFILMLVVGRLMPYGSSNTTQLMTQQAPRVLIFTGIFTILLAPITEEFFFRVSLSTLFTNKYLYMVTSSILFSLLHIQYGNILTNLPILIITMSTGLLLSNSYWKDKNSMKIMIAHIVYNAIIFGLSIA